ncbi:hypothetical protein DL98DRAFT_523066 [Cadophora sp. DSE1049]|nr:hypothetical protein DL98DRAFT_523066 [Cadophora sp. DSE1049]
MDKFDYRDVPINTSPATPTERQIRLLTIYSATVCTLKTFTLAQKPKYEALSYCWGPKASGHLISINEQPFMVQPNLFGALHRLQRAGRPREMWIDAICIDQSSVNERNFTVPFMSDIYANAYWGVVAWIGEEGPDTELVQPFVEHLTDGFNPRKDTYRLPPLNDPGYRALYHFLLTTWSSRVWIVQEVVMAPRRMKLKVMRGRHVLEMKNIALAMSVIYKYNLEPKLGFQYPPRFATLWAEKIQHKDKPALLNIVTRNWLTYASDSRDKIYGLAGLDEEFKRKHIKIDYAETNTVEAVFTDFARRCLLEYGNLEILGALSSATDKHLSTVPSWVPDWTDWKAQTFLFMSAEPDAEGRGLRHFTAAGEDSTACNPTFLGNDENMLQLKGCIIDTIIDIGPVLENSGRAQDALQFLWESEFVAQVQSEYTIVENKRNYGETIVNITSKKTYAQTGEPLLQAYYATLTMDSLHSRHIHRRFDSFRRSRRLRKAYYNYHALTHIIRKNSDIPLFLSINTNNMRLSLAMNHEVNVAMSVSLNRQLVRTSKHGYLGMVTARAREGDKVVLLKGARVPLIIRPTKDGEQAGQRFHMIGDGYFHGIMSGEVWKGENCEELVFV